MIGGPDVRRLGLDTVGKTQRKQALLLCQHFIQARKENKQRQKCDCACVGVRGRVRDDLSSAVVVSSLEQSNSLSTK